MIEEGDVINVPYTEVFDAGTSGLFGGRIQYLEFQIQKKDLLKWFNDIPKYILIESGELKRREQILDIDRQKVERTADNSPVLGITHSPTAYYYNFKVERSELQRVFHKNKVSRMGVEHISLKVLDWEL